MDCAYVQIPHCVLLDPHLNPTALRVYSYLRFRSYRKNHCTVKYETMTKDLQISQATIQRGLRSLAETGLVEITKRKRSNRYKLPALDTVYEDPKTSGLSKRKNPVVSTSPCKSGVSIPIKNDQSRLITFDHSHTKEKLSTEKEAKKTLKGFHSGAVISPLGRKENAKRLPKEGKNDESAIPRITKLVETTANVCSLSFGSPESLGSWLSIPSHTPWKPESGESLPTQLDFTPTPPPTTTPEETTAPEALKRLEKSDSTHDSPQPDPLAEQIQHYMARKRLFYVELWLSYILGLSLGVFYYREDRANEEEEMGSTEDVYMDENGNEIPAWVQKKKKVTKKKPQSSRGLPATTRAILTGHWSDLMIEHYHLKTSFTGKNIGHLRNVWEYVCKDHQLVRKMMDILFLDWEQAKARFKVLSDKNIPDLWCFDVLKEQLAGLAKQNKGISSNGAHRVSNFDRQHGSSFKDEWENI